MNKKGRESASFWSGKGFYLALALCVTAAVVVSITAITAMINDTTTPELTEEKEKSWGIEDIGVEEKKQDVPITSSSQSTQSSSSSSQSLPQEPTQDVENSVVQPILLAEWSILPVQGEVLAQFSGEELVYNETLADWRTHNGVDIKATFGESVKNCATGEVASVTESGMWGYVVTVGTLDGYVCRYTGLSDKNLVKEGTTIGVGDVLGEVGEIPAEIVLEPHIHFEVEKDGKLIDPMTLLAH